MLPPLSELPQATYEALSKVDSQAIAVVALAGTLMAVIHRHLNGSPKNLPPGPPADSLIWGNNIPDCYAYRYFETLTKQYGPVFSIRQGLTTIVVVGRFQAAVEIMEREGANSADRPVSIAAGETLSGGMRVLLTPLGERFKKMRKALHSHLQPKVVQSYGPTLMKTARQHILDVARDPSKHQEHAKRYAASVVMYLAYGKEPNTSGYDDPDVEAVNRCLTRLGVTIRPGVWKVDFFPFLRYIPGYLKELKDGHAEELGLFKRHLSDVKAKMDRGEEIPNSFGRYLLERQSELGLSDGETAYLAGSMFGAGSDTTASAISVCVLASVMYPEEQQKVWEELERVIGRERPPTFDDEKELKYLEAFVLESFRWRPVTAGGFAHKATKDIVWRDMVIPKGASVIGNVWSVGRDPQYFPDPEEFKPSRWIDEKGNIREDLKSYPFGFGRRVCPGQHMAHASVWLNTALLIWSFKMTADPKHPIDPLDFTESANAHPRPFKVNFAPRFAGSMGDVVELLDGYGL